MIYLAFHLDFICYYIKVFWVAEQHQHEALCKCCVVYVMSKINVVSCRMMQLADGTNALLVNVFHFLTVKLVSTTHSTTHPR